MRSVKCLMLGVMLTVCTGCPPVKPSASGRVDVPVTAGTRGTVAVVNGEALSLAEFERRIESLPPYTRARYATTEAKLEFLEAQVEFELLADVAEKKSLDAKPEVRQAVKQVLVKHWVDEQLRHKIKLTDITAEEIRQVYEADPSRFRVPEQRRVAIIGSLQHKTAAALLQLMNDQTFETSLQKLNMFRRLADVHHIDPSMKRKGGDFGLVEDPSATRANSTSKLHSEIATQIFLGGHDGEKGGRGVEQVGELTPVFEVDGVFYIATIIEIIPSRTRELRDVEDEIREPLYQSRRAAERATIFDELRKRSPIKVWEDVLASVEAPHAPDQTLERLLRGTNKVPVPGARP